MKIAENFLVNFDTPFENIWDTPIYRIFSMEKFLTSLNENMLFLVKTKLWEDPFEAFLLKQVIWKTDGTEDYPFAKNLTENFYGHCWTFLPESNFLWKIYAPSSDGIMVKSSLRKLYNLFMENPSSTGQYFLGKIDYWQESRILEYFENQKMAEELFSETGNKLLLKSLFIKRKEFAEEQEVRLVYYSENTFGDKMPITKVGFEFKRVHLFNELSDELILDPRVDYIRQDSISHLIKKLGFTGTIKKSSLFNAPILKLRV